MINLHTYYNGYHFRSRTEARWAVFFDSIGIKYRYEHEDYILSNGKRYLPDFWLPEFDGGVFAEVKGVFTADDIETCQLLAELTNRPVIMLEDVPDFKIFKYFDFTDSAFCDNPECSPINLFWPDCEFEKHGKCRISYPKRLSIIDGLFYIDEGRIWVYPGFEDKNGYFEEGDWPSYKKPVFDSRSKRFEF